MDEVRVDSSEQHEEHHDGSEATASPLPYARSRVKLPALLSLFYRHRAEAVKVWNDGLHDAYRGRLTCRAGCSSCCSLLAMCTWTEGAIILLGAKPAAIGKAIEQGKRQLELMIGAGWTKEPTPAAEKKRKAAVDAAAYAWRRQNEKCAFYGNDSKCEIYAIRPAVCSTLWSLTPPAECLDDAKPTELTRNDEVLKHIAMLDARILKELGVKTSTSAAGIAFMPIGVQLARVHCVLKGVLESYDATRTAPA